MPTQTPLPLKDLHLPAPIGWWPPAPGWWLLAAFLLLCVALGCWAYWRFTRKTAVKTAHKQLLAIKHNTVLDNQQKLAELSILLRRVAISLYPRAQVAGLTGQAWQDFLNQALPNRPFNGEYGQLLVEASYRQQPLSPAQLQHLLGLCEIWLNAQSKRTQPKSRP
ncbi:MAG: DUF4381 domain-containing protein [Methylococcaceae bacterium]|nr:DUF4381 domain-containing protein [Methylococcaceae bacterium]